MGRLSLDLTLQHGIGGSSPDVDSLQSPRATARTAGEMRIASRPRAQAGQSPGARDQDDCSIRLVHC